METIVIENDVQSDVTMATSRWRYNSAWVAEYSRDEGEDTVFIKNVQYACYIFVKKKIRFKHSIFVVTPTKIVRVPKVPTIRLRPGKLCSNVHL